MLPIPRACHSNRRESRHVASLQVQAPRLFLKGISSAICPTTLLLQLILMRCSRLQQELMSLMVNGITAKPTAHPPSAPFSLCATQMSGDEGISAFPKDDNLFEWLGTIHGSAGTVYEGLEYKISLKFGPKYPNEPPQVPACTAATAPQRPTTSHTQLTVQIHNARVSPECGRSERQYLPRYPHR